MTGKMEGLNPMKRLLMLAIVLAFSLPIAPAPSVHGDSGNGIHVVVMGLRNNDGRVGCSLYNDPASFPVGKTKEFRSVAVGKHQQVAVCDFMGVPAGIYAVSVLDDTNMNGKMDFNFIGLPTKGYGFSNDAKATLSAPSFSAASFSYSGTGALRVPIKIVYWLR